MSRTKVKQNVIDVSPGGILEQVMYRADGRTIATKQGNITAPNVTASQQTTGSHVLASGSNIDYIPPVGATLVHYKYSWQSGPAAASTLVHAKVQLDNSSGTLTDISQSRRTYYAIQLKDFWVYTEAWIRINGTEDVANEQVGAWTAARTIQTTVMEYSSSFRSRLHDLYHWDGAGNTGIITKPTVEITAYS